MTERLTGDALSRAMSETISAIWNEIQAHPDLKDCKSWSEMDDLCDANCLGGMCDDDHWVWFEHDPETGMHPEIHEAVEFIRNRINERLMGSHKQLCG